MIMTEMGFVNIRKIQTHRENSGGGNFIPFEMNFQFLSGFVFRFPFEYFQEQKWFYDFSGRTVVFLGNRSSDLFQLIWSHGKLVFQSDFPYEMSHGEVLLFTGDRTHSENCLQIKFGIVGD
jgi:hypothetical protein